jgi:succinyl-diaminopimelate desuccinylase
MSRLPVDRVLKEISEREIVDLTAELVRIPSVFRPGEPEANERAVALSVEGWLRHEGFAVEVQEVTPGRPNVIGWLDGGQPGEILCLEGHTDASPRVIPPRGVIRRGAASSRTDTSTGAAART